jgi:predicted ATPase
MSVAVRCAAPRIVKKSHFESNQRIGHGLKIRIRNMGPVKTAEIDLKPLVIFIGPNNAGKSFVATLLYASLSQTGVASSLQVARTMRRASWDEELDESGADILSFIASAVESEGHDTYRQMPDSARSFFAARLNDSLGEYMISVAEEIVRTTRTNFGSIRRRANQRATAASMKISSDRPAWGVQLDMRSRGGNIDIAAPADLHEVWRLIPPSTWRRLSRSAVSRSFRLRELISDLARTCFREVPLHTKYLPAARSGILQSHKALAGSLVRRSTLAGIEDLRIPAMSGVVADFLGEMVELNPSPDGDFAEEASRLEQEILHGQIGLLGDRETSPEVIYRTPGADYPLGRTSSMVSELAPVVLYLRHRLRRGDLLLIEEPEAHLHPGTQVAFAKCLVRLVNSGLRITLTTHSEFFLQQINNAIVAGSVSSNGNSKAEIVTDRLQATDVSAYFFNPSPNGTVVMKLPVEPGEGIPDSSFSTVSEQLYNEALVLDRSIERDEAS